MAQTLQQGAMIADASITPEKLANTAFNQLRSGRKNAIINGNFDIWQRGTSIGGALGTDVYLADRWLHNDNSGNATVSRQDFAVGQTDVPHNPKHFLRWEMTQVGAGATVTAIAQRIEGVRTFAGEEVTLSFWAKANGNFGIDVGYEQGFGSGGTPSAKNDVNIANNLQLTTSWQKFEFTFTVDSIAGKTLGTDGNDNLEIYFGQNLAELMAIDLAQVQLERGSVATEFEYRPIEEETALCQRYYEKTYNVDVAPATIINDGRCFRRGISSESHSIGMEWRFAVQKRVAPTITLYSPATGATGVIRIVGADVAAGAFSTGRAATGAQINVGQSVAANAEVSFHATADAEI